MKRLAWYAVGQALVQALSFAAAILVVRGLGKEQYAWYTIAMAVVAACGALSNSGVSLAMNRLGGPVAGDDARFAAIVALARRARHRLGLLVVPPALIVLAVLLARNHAGWAELAVICALVAVSAWAEMRSQLATAAMQLRLRAGTAQGVEFAAAAFRLGWVGLARLGWLTATGILVGWTAASAARALLLRSRLGLPEADPDESSSTEMMRIVRQTAPSAVFFAVQSQAGIVLGAILGGTAAVADLGALSRFAVLLTLLYAPINAIIVPRFSRAVDVAELHRLFRRYLAWVLAIAVGVCVAAVACPRLALQVIGGRYAGLEREVGLMGLQIALSFLVHALFAVNASKAWIGFTSWFNPLATIALQAALVFTLDLSTVAGLLWFGIASLVPNLISVVVDLARGFGALSRPVTA